MRPADTDLFGYPLPDFEQDQFFTPMWLARRAAAWRIRVGFRVLEPACGPGNMIAALLEAGHRAENIIAVERDPRQAAFARARFGGSVEVICGDFFEVAHQLGPVDAILGNFPFRDNEHLRFTVTGLDVAQEITAIYPVTFESTQGRDRDLWANKGLVTHRVTLPERVLYAENGGSFESTVLRIVRRTRPRHPRDVRTVYEETWREDDEEIGAQVLAHLREVP